MINKTFIIPIEYWNDCFWIPVIPDSGFSDTKQGQFVFFKRICKNYFVITIP